MYARLIPLLASRYHVVAPDYPGFGHSDAPSPDVFAYTFDNIAKLVDRLLDQIGIGQCAFFLQDYGGPVGFRIMLERPERSTAVIIQNANAYLDGLGPKWSGIARFWADRRANRSELTTFVSLESARRRHVGDSPRPDHYDPDGWTDEFAYLSRPGVLRIQGDLLHDYQSNVAAYPAWQAWMRTRRPETLILWGRYDPSFVVAGAHAYLRDLPDASLHLLDGGHFVLDECLEEAAALTLGFLSRALGRTLPCPGPDRR
jgi:pimeloyl-ACP methyl ester carboxylesterase